MVKKQKAEKVTSKNRPTGVAILSILGYIVVAILAIAGLAIFFVGSVILEVVPAAIAAYAGIIGTILIIFAVVEFFIARGLWNGKDWARIITLVLASIGFLSSLSKLDILFLVIDGLIIWYLGFNQEVKNYFK